MIDNIKMFHFLVKLSKSIVRHSALSSHYLVKLISMLIHNVYNTCVLHNIGSPACWAGIRRHANHYATEDCLSWSCLSTWLHQSNIGSSQFWQENPNSNVTITTISFSIEVFKIKISFWEYFLKPRELTETIGNL